MISEALRVDRLEARAAARAKVRFCVVTPSISRGDKPSTKCFRTLGAAKSYIKRAAASAKKSADQRAAYEKRTR